MSRDSIRGYLIIIAIAALETAFFDVSARVAGLIMGALGLIFLILLWVFAYTWYRNNRMAISLMPDRQRNVMYLAMMAVTVPAAVYSITRIIDFNIGAWAAPLLLIFLVGVFGMFWAWQESKRYYF
jgi:formate hydrogenlyase subunit 3/multisubunit Na+/H+ antiporter MnhD subunit